MWIVRLALRRPYTFIVMALLIAILGGTVDLDHANGRISLYQHPGGWRDLVLLGHESG